MDDQKSDSSDYEVKIVYQTLKRIKPHKLTETERYNDRYTTTKFSPPPRTALTGYPEMVLQELDRCRPNPDWDTVYDPVSRVQVTKLEWTLDNLLAFAPNSGATKNMDNFPSDINLAGTIDAHLIIMETQDVVPLDLMAKVQSNTKLIPKPLSPSSSHPVRQT